MKIKRFNNLWAMGLILFGALLIAFYLAKIFFPEFIVGVAEIPSIVKLGEYVDTHKWAKHTFNISNMFITLYFYFGACCKSLKFTWKGYLVIILDIVLLTIFSEFITKYYTTVNYVCMVFIPFLLCVVEKKISKETFISTVVCFTIDITAQIMSLEIRNLMSLIHNVNSATFFVLMIDMFIWRIILYLFFNYKKEE